MSVDVKQRMIRHVATEIRAGMTVNLGVTYVSTQPGTAFFDSAVSFALVRGGRLDLSVLGAFEVAMGGPSPTG